MNKRNLNGYLKVVFKVISLKVRVIFIWSLKKKIKY